MRLLLFAAMLSIAVTGHAQDSLVPADRKALENRARFQMLDSATSLPAEVYRLCVDPNGFLAAPGERWNATDVMVPGLAFRRLVWAARSPEFIVVHYEQGGFVHTHHVVAARIGRNPAGYELTWRAEVPRLRAYADFVRALKSNTFVPEAPTSTEGSTRRCTGRRGRRSRQVRFRDC